MSDATYRIDVTHEPSSPEDTLPYVARASRFSGEVEFSAWGGTAQIALSRVRGMIALVVEGPQTFYTDENGNFVEPPVEHSVKARDDMPVRTYKVTDGVLDPSSMEES